MPGFQITTLHFVRQDEISRDCEVQGSGLPGLGAVSPGKWANDGEPLKVETRSESGPRRPKSSFIPVWKAQNKEHWYNFLSVVYLFFKDSCFK